jgi:hypothetical protein
MTGVKMSRGKRRLVTASVIAVVYAAGVLAAMREGYAFGRDVPVRCRQGHLFSTIWIPGASIKALRLGLWRLQWCPVGRHVDLVRLVKESDLSPAEREFAEQHHDLRVP